MKNTKSEKDLIRVITPSVISGTVKAPSSKSMMQRAVACALLCNGQTEILNPSFCDDSRASLGIAEALGATIKIEKNRVVVTGAGKPGVAEKPGVVEKPGVGLKPVSNTLNCGEAGLCLRMFSPITALCDEEIEISGLGSLLKRPISMIESPLKDLGAKCVTNNGFLPARIHGPMKGGKAIVDGSISSQFLTGLILALPIVMNDTILDVKDLKSRPYIDMTLKVQSEFGVCVENQEYKRFLIPGNQQYRSTVYNVEGDWSGTAFLLVAGAISGEVNVTGIDIESNQADKAILEAIERAGAQIDMSLNRVVVKKKYLKAFEFDATECPDLFPPLVALAVHCSGRTFIKGVSRLKHKESDRGEALKLEFSKLGAEIHLNGDVMEINGSTLTGGDVDSHNDHRMAMALAVTATNGTGEVTVNGSECISKSYPEFFDDLYNLS